MVVVIIRVSPPDPPGDPGDYVRDYLVLSLVWGGGIDASKIRVSCALLVQLPLITLVLSNVWVLALKKMD